MRNIDGGYARETVSTWLQSVKNALHRNKWILQVFKRLTEKEEVKCIRVVI
jgi:hypothetical protein